MQIFFTEKNWIRFAIGKITTIRTRERKEGIYTAYRGRFNRKILGKVKISKPTKICKVSELTEQDAKNDGFLSLAELLLELGRLNAQITVNTFVYIYPVEVIENVDR